MRLQQNRSARRGVILLVVLAMLTLFAIVGISFVLYATAEANSARIARESESLSRPDMDPEQCLAFFLGQLIYDCKDDTTGIYSALRGNSLARSMYGYNYTVQNGQILPVDANGAPLNTVPYNGTGKLSYVDPATGMSAANRVNYIYFGNGTVSNPERVGSGTPANPISQSAYVGGFNPPYTYPDLNSFFLAAVKADGTLISPSFHRSWLFGALNDPTNPSWAAPNCFYLSPRPSPQVNPGFPYPEDPGGDVKNLVWAPGGNDSIWMDIGAPIMTAPDGTLYKMLVAPLILDLDGRVNLGTAGNLLGQGQTHASNQGWGGWEVNLSKVMQGDPTGQEVKSLFLGNATTAGKYGPDQMPSAGQAASSPPWPNELPQPPTIVSGLHHFYAPTDLNGVNEAAAGQPSSQPAPPTTTASPWATFAQGYQSGGDPELNNPGHPSLYDVYRSALASMSDDRVFSAASMEALLRPTSATGLQVDTGSVGLFSDLLRLCPLNFGPLAASPRSRNLVTTLSNDLGAAGQVPWWYTAPTNTYSNAANPMQAPSLAAGLPFPLNPTPDAGASPLTVPGGQLSEFSQPNNQPLAQALFTTLGRINLNQQLVPYPHMGSGFVPPYTAPLVSYATPYDLTQPNIKQQYLAAVQARQNLANDIYRRLVSLTGINGNTTAPDNTGTPAAPQGLTAHRWLAQLAVNIVDFIDEDDISTPFNFYNTQDQLPAAQIGATAGGDTAGPPQGPPPTGANPMYWVFGTELPRVVLNEVVIQTNAGAAPAVANGAQMQAWVELFNPMLAASPSTPNVQQIDFYRVPLYMGQPNAGGYSPYRISISDALMTAGLQPNANVLGKPATTAAAAGPPATTGYPFETTDADFSAVPSLIGGGSQATPGAGNVNVAGVDPQSFFLLGPPTPVAAPFQDPFVPQNQNANGVPNNTPVVRTASMSATESFPNGATDARTTGLTICLRRLANPYLPFDGTPTDPTYNPYVTVDYLASVPMNTMVANMANAINSRGKTQPYAAFSQLAAAGGTAVAATSPVQDQQGNTVNNVINTFGLQNNPVPPSNSYDWLVFLDRAPISPIELLHVPGYQPYQLTQQLMTGDNTKTANAFQHVAPWFLNPSTGLSSPGTLLYRLLEQFECGNRGNGADFMAYAPGRIPGKINLNTIWDPEVFLALCDANTSLGAGMNDTVMVQVFQNLLQSRSPGALAATPQLTPTDEPFLPLSVGYTAAGAQYPQGLSYQNTILRPSPTNPQLLLFENPSNPAPAGPNQTLHPYNRYQLLTKIFNNITTRSNTFAVFMTVGFFQVSNPNASPPTLGSEVGRSEGRHIRHRMFALIDRTQLASFSAPFSSGVLTGPPAGQPPQPVQLSTIIPQGGNVITSQASQIQVLNPNTGVTCSIVAGMQLTIEPGTDSEETVTVQVDTNGTTFAPGTLYATFIKAHPNPHLNSPLASQVIVSRGNPGPWLRYDPWLDPGVVPYFSIID